MAKMICNRSECFYCAKGKCVSLSVTSSERCNRHMKNFLAHDRTKRRPLNLKNLRKTLEAQAPLYPVAAQPVQKPVAA